MFNSNANVPTDNIYKFFAILGLVLTVFGGYIFNSTHNNFNNNLFKYAINLSKLELIEKPNLHEEMQIAALEKRIELLKADKPFNMNVSSFFVALGLILMSYGFIRWHFHLQPKLDELLDLQLKKARADASGNKHIKFKRK
ncbi:hypothetical protein [Vibrio echinoideorum]|uniref:Uncharacterized protein n=1 Tax=Vibrio echinoideorum TaxID=2100116 RepID=A0ABU9FL37_9VIBR